MSGPFFLFINIVFFSRLIKTMSVPLLIGNFTSEADFKKQVADYQRLLKLRSKLNAENEQYSFQIEENMAGIPIAPSPYKSITENTSDQFALIQRATAELQPYLGQEASSFVLLYLTSIPELQLFVLKFPAFERKYLIPREGSLLTIGDVNNIWEEFKATIVPEQQQQQPAASSVSSPTLLVTAPAAKPAVPTSGVRLRTQIRPGGRRVPRPKIPTENDLITLAQQSSTLTNFKNSLKDQYRQTDVGRYLEKLAAALDVPVRSNDTNGVLWTRVQRMVDRIVA